MLTTFGIVITALALFGVYYFLAFLVRELAKRNLFWTLAEEGTAKAIMRNGRFIFCVMSFSGHMFRTDTRMTRAQRDMLSQIDEWDIVPYDNLHRRRYLPLLRNIRWIGLPPFTDAHNYRFTWTSLEEESTGTGDLIKKYKNSEEPVDYILVQDDVYVTKVTGIECRDNIPLDVVILVGGRVVNPYKALFAVERWLEATLNRVGSKTRDILGQLTYAQIRDIQVTSAAAPAATPVQLTDVYREVTDEVKNHWGFDIKFIRIYQVDPGSELAAEFIRASTVLYVAQEQRKADEEAGLGFAARDKAHIDAITSNPRGPEVFKWMSIKDSKLTTYVEGGGIQATIPVGGQAPQPNP